MEKIFKLLRDNDVEMSVRKSPDPGDQGLRVMFEKEVNGHKLSEAQIVYPYGRYMVDDVEYALKKFLKGLEVHKVMRTIKNPEI